MQTWITDNDFYKSASNLNRQHLQAQIYEGIHILASLLDVNDKLVNPKRNVKNHPASKLWVGYEIYLYTYIKIHMAEWEFRGYKANINKKNIDFLLDVLKKLGRITIIIDNPDWITNELIQTHRSRLIQKEIVKEELLKLKYNRMVDINQDYMKKEKEKNIKEQKNNHHYRNLWPDCPTNLEMRYNWRKDI